MTAAETPRTDERATLSEAPPKTWPENAYPTGAQYAAWLRLLTPEQQAEHLSGVIEQAERGAWCDVGSHSHRLAAAVTRAEAAEARVAAAETQWGLRIQIGEGAAHVITARDEADALDQYDQWPQAERSIVSRRVTAWTTEETR